MKVLAFDCATNILATALETEAGISIRVFSGGLRHAELLMPTVASLLSDAGLEPSDLDLIVCGKGPGSFTGLRIAMASAKGISAGSAVPLVSVPSLDWIAEPFRASEGLVVPVIDARKGRLYAGIYSQGKRSGDWLDLSSVDLVGRLEGREEILFTGPDADLLSEMAAERPGWDIDRFYRCPRPECLISLGKEAFEMRGADSPAESPLYFRESEADLGIQSSAGKGS